MKHLIKKKIDVKCEKIVHILNCHDSSWKCKKKMELENAQTTHKNWDEIHLADNDAQTNTIELLPKIYHE